MSTNTTFTPAGTVTVSPDVVAASFAMPAPDGANIDTMVACTNAPCWIAFGTGAVVSGSGAAPGSIMVTPGAPLLLTTSATTLAATATNPNVLGGVPATQAAAATTFNCLTMQRGGAITVTRGTAAPRTTF